MRPRRPTPHQTKSGGGNLIDPSPKSENRSTRRPIPARPLPRPIRAALEAAGGDLGRVGAVYDRLASALEADAERLETFERMDADRTDLPGAWPTLRPNLEESPS